jgi:hypothetical protein
MSFDVNKKAKIVVVTGGPTEPVKKSSVPKAPASPQFPEEAALMKLLMDQPYDHLKFIASLIRLPRWREESWTLDKKRGGWLNWKNGKFGEFVSLAQLEAAIDSRILELGLDRELIEEWLEQPGSAHEVWQTQDFETQMRTFRRREETK